jgi:hypothetical protein
LSLFRGARRNRKDNRFHVPRDSQKVPWVSARNLAGAPQHDREAAGGVVVASRTGRQVDVRPQLRADLRTIMDRELPHWQEALEYLGRSPGAEA